MKAILVTLVCIASLGCSSPAAKALAGEAPTGEIPAEFVYVHGTNQNTAESKKHFENSVNRLHHEIITAFDSSNLIQDDLLQDGKYDIDSTSLPISWSAGRFEDVFSLLVSHMLKYMIEHEMVWLHINRIQDPIGFPLPAYDSIMERIRTNQDIVIEPKGGMIASNSNIRGAAFVQNAHGWYWRRQKLFARALVNTYEKGYAREVEKINTKSE